MARLLIPFVILCLLLLLTPAAGRGVQGRSVSNESEDDFLDNIDFDENFEYESDQQRLKRKSDRHYAVVVAIDSDAKPTSINSFKRFGIMPGIDDNISVDKSIRPYLGLSDSAKYNTNKEKKPKIEELIKTLQTMMDNDDCGNKNNQGNNKKQHEKNDNADDDVSPEIQNDPTINDDESINDNNPSDKKNEDDDDDDNNDNDPDSNVKNNGQDDDFTPTKNNNNNIIKKSKSRKCQPGTVSTKSGSRRKSYSNNNDDVGQDDEGDDEVNQRQCSATRSQGSKRKKQKQSTDNRCNSNQQGNDSQNLPGVRGNNKGKINPNQSQQLPPSDSDIYNDSSTNSKPKQYNEESVPNNDEHDYSVKNTGVQPIIQKDQIDDNHDYEEETQNGNSDDYDPNTSKNQGNKCRNRSSSTGTSGSQSPTKISLGSRYKCSQPKICTTPIKNGNSKSISGKKTQQITDPSDVDDNTAEYNDHLSPPSLSSKRSKTGLEKSKSGISQRSKSLNKVIPVLQANYDTGDTYRGSGDANYDDDENIDDDFNTGQKPVPQYPSSSAQQQNNQIFNQPKRKSPYLYSDNGIGDECDEDPTTQSPSKSKTTTQFISYNDDGQNINRPLRSSKKNNRQSFSNVDDEDRKDNDDEDSLNNVPDDVHNNQNSKPSRSGSHSSDCSLRDNLKKLEEGLKDAFGVQCKCKKAPSNNSGGQNKRGKNGGSQTSDNNCSGESRQRRQRGAIYFHDLMSALPVANPKETSALIKIIESYKSSLTD